MAEASALKIVIDAENRSKAAMDEAMGQMDKVKGKLEQMQPAFRKMAMIGAAGFAAVTGAVALSIKEFASFDDAMTKSTAIMGDVSDELRKEMEKNAREVAKTTTFSAKEAADSYFYLASAGLDAAQSIALLPVVAKFATAGAFDMALATDLLTDAQSALGLTVEDVTENMGNMARVGDVLVKANTLANATVQQFSESLTTEAGAALKTFNKDIEEGVAVLAAFADQGVKGQVAGSGLSRIMRLLTDSAIKNREEMDALGISVFDSEGKMRNFADIIEDMEGALMGMSDEQRTASLESIGFTARIQGIILPLLGTSDAIREYEKELRSAGGITQEVADKQLESFAAQMSMLKSKVSDAAIELGSIFAPIVASLVKKISPLIEKFVEWVSENTTLVIAITIITAALFGLVAIVGVLGLILPTLIASFKILAGSMIIAKIAAFALSAVPIIAFFTVLAGLVLLVYNELQKFGKEVGGLRNAWYLTLMEMKITFLEFVETVLNGINKIAQYLPTWNVVVGKSLKFVREEIRKTKEDFNSLAVEGMNKAKESSDDLTGGIKDFGKVATEAMINATKSVSGLGGAVKETVKEIEDANKKHKERMESDEKSFYDSLAKKVAEYEIEVSDMREKEKAKRDELANMEEERKQMKETHNEWLYAEMRMTGVSYQEAIKRKDARMTELNDNLRSYEKEADEFGNAAIRKQHQLDKFYTWDIDITKEIEWEKKLLSVGELERMYLEYQKKREMAEEEHNKLLAEIKERDVKKAAEAQADLTRIENVKDEFVKAEDVKTKAVERRIEVQRRASLEMGGGFTTARSTVPFYGFQHGGVVPGRIGEPVPALVHGGETIIPPGKGIGGLTINVYGDVTGQDIIDKVGKGLMDLIKRNKRI